MSDGRNSQNFASFMAKERAKRRDRDDMDDPNLCMFNPCTNPRCSFNHNEGQQKTHKEIAAQNTRRASNIMDTKPSTLTAEPPAKRIRTGETYTAKDQFFKAAESLYEKTHANFRTDNEAIELRTRNRELELEVKKLKDENYDMERVHIGYHRELSTDNRELASKLGALENEISTKNATLYATNMSLTDAKNTSGELTSKIVAREKCLDDLNKKNLELTKRITLYEGTVKTLSDEKYSLEEKVQDLESKLKLQTDISDGHATMVNQMKKLLTG